MSFTSIIHSIAWVLFQNVARAMPGQSPVESRGNRTVRNGSIFPHCQNFDDYDRAFAVLTAQGLLEPIPFPIEMASFSTEKEFLVYKLQLDQPDLSEHLRSIEPVFEMGEAELIGTFLDLARNLGRGANSDGLSPIPVRRGPMPFPEYFDAAVTALARLGYCLKSGRTMSWLPKIQPVMVAEGIWRGDQPVADTWRAEFRALLLLAPSQLRARFALETDVIQPLIVHWAFRHHWDPALGWCIEQRSVPLDTRYHPFSMTQLVEIAFAE